MPVIQRKGAQSSQGFGEFAQSSTAANYIEDYFSTYLYTGNAATQTISNGIGLADTAAWSSYQLQQNDSSGQGVTTDSSGNFYVTGYANDGSYYALISKYSSSGVIQWQRKLASCFGYSIATDSSGNVYVTGDYSGAIIIAKYNSSGTIQWQRNLLQNTSGGRGITVDVSGNVYVTGYASDGAATNYIIVAKYNSSGVIQWKRKLQQNGSQGKAISTDSSGNVYVTGYANDGTNNYIIIVKYDSTGTIQWQRKLQQNGSDGRGIAIDSSGNVYITGRANDGSNDYVIIAKYNSSGTIQWQRKLQELQSLGYGISTDSSGNVYVAGRVDDSTNRRISVAKYNSSGTIQWQSKLYQNQSEGYGISTDSSGNVYVTGYATNTSSVAYIVTTKLKQDGTALSGTAIVTLTAGTATDSAGAATDSAAGATDSAAGAATDSAGTATDSAGTATATSASVAAVTGAGGLVWMHVRSGTTADHHLYDTNRGATKMISSNTTGGEITRTNGLTAFTANGFSIGNYSEINGSGNGMASWTFREQAKFFDVVTYTGDGSTTRQISHNLGSAPGCMIVKSLNNALDWFVWHRSTPGAGYTLNLNKTDAAYNSDNWGAGRNTPPTSTVFTVGDNANVLGYTYVAYLFAHDAGGFGSAGTDNVISCGSYTGNGTSNGPVVNLGFEPQWLLIKNASAYANWFVLDNMRGLNLSTITGSADAALLPNSSSAEINDQYIDINATGFQPKNGGSAWNWNGDTYIYIAIRRGPMKTPTSGTSVFSPVARTGTGATATITNGFVTDLIIAKRRSAGYDGVFDRLRGSLKQLITQVTDAEDTNAAGTTLTSFSSNTGVTVGADTVGPINTSAINYANWSFSRAPGFFDEVCYTGDGVSGRAITHNLAAAPELIITKDRSRAGTSWTVWNKDLPSGYVLILQSSNPQDNGWGTNYIGTPGATSYQIGVTERVNQTGDTYVAYLFASCPGVSKVGSYTGTGALQTVNCGFTSGARFVLIKRTDDAGDWYVWDSARGISSGNDPYLLLNSTAAEVTTTNYIDTDTTGFKVTAAAPAALNASGGSYIFLAIA